MEKQYIVRDLRKKEQFIVDDAYLNGYAKLVSPFATLAYLSLCRHADKGQQAFPSYEKIAEEFNISKRSAIRGIKELQEWHILEVIKEKDDKTKRQKPNIYILLNKSEWKPKPIRVTDIHPDNEKAECPESIDPGAPQSQSRVTDMHCKETQFKETHIKDSNEGVAGDEIGKVIDSFKEINPSYKKWFGNTTQRSAASRLIEIHGLELVLKYIEALKYTNAQPYAPTVTTPLQLEDKLADLKAWSDKVKNKSETPKYKPIKIIEV